MPKRKKNHSTPPLRRLTSFRVLIVYSNCFDYLLNFLIIVIITIPINEMTTVIFLLFNTNTSSHRPTLHWRLRLSSQPSRRQGLLRLVWILTYETEAFLAVCLCPTVVVPRQDSHAFSAESRPVALPVSIDHVVVSVVRVDATDEVAVDAS